MQQADDKQLSAPTSGTGDDRMSPAWRKLLAAPAPATDVQHGVLGFFVEVLGADGGAFAHVDVAPVWLTVAGRGRYVRPLPLDSRHLLQSPLQAHEQRLAATMLGLPQTLRKGRSYARLKGQVGNTLLAEVLDTAPCFLGGLGGLRLSRGKSRPLNWHWRMEPDGSQRLLPILSANQRLLWIDALWYLDAERATLGVLDGALEESPWLTLPPLRHEYGKRMRTRLPDSHVALRVPPRLVARLYS